MSRRMSSTLQMTVPQMSTKSQTHLATMMMMTVMVVVAAVAAQAAVRRLLLLLTTVIAKVVMTEEDGSLHLADLVIQEAVGMARICPLWAFLRVHRHLT